MQACQDLCSECVKCLWFFRLENESNVNSLHISVALGTLPHYISFQNLLSLHSTDLPVFVSDWFWMKTTNKSCITSLTLTVV